MNGPEIYSFTMRTVPNLIEATLEKNCLSRNDIDHWVFHQANRFMLEALRDKLELPEDRFCIDVEETGNTVSSTIPIALRRAMGRREILPGQRVLIAGFGVGYSWGATVLTI
jgi:3-oxoacyl-[acyl-carrier-protein] synthase-3